ncbi:MAG: hypothetical protein RLZZ135_2035, partial [Cyanobacteriota bacterium]
MYNDKAGKEHWDSVWEGGEIPAPIDPHLMGFRNAKSRRYHEYFSQVFADLETKGLKLLEIGCATSQLLPYFAKEFGCDIYGLDYSEVGCIQSRQVLANAGVKGQIICADLFLPPKNLIDLFDVVFSFGVAEHFESTSDCLMAFSKFLKPGGKIVTIIPNMTGLDGQLQKILNRDVFDIHVLLDAEKLALAHQVAGFSTLDCNYFISPDFSIPNLNGLDRQLPSTQLKQFFLDNL